MVIIVVYCFFYIDCIKYIVYSKFARIRPNNANKN